MRVLRFSVVVDSSGFNESAFHTALVLQFAGVGVSSNDVALEIRPVSTTDASAIDPLLPTAGDAVLGRRLSASAGYLVINIAIAVPSSASSVAIDSIAAVANTLTQSRSYLSSALGVSAVTIPALPTIASQVLEALPPGLVASIGLPPSIPLVVSLVSNTLPPSVGASMTVDPFGVPQLPEVIVWDVPSAEVVAAASTTITIAVAIGVGASVATAVGTSVGSTIAASQGGAAATSGSASSSAGSIAPLVFGVQRLAMRASVASDEAGSVPGLVGAFAAPLRGFLGASGVWRLLLTSDDAPATPSGRRLSSRGVPSNDLPGPVALLVDETVTIVIALVFTIAIHALLLWLWRAPPSGDEPSGGPPKDGTHPAKKRWGSAPLPASLVALNPELTVLLFFAGGLSTAAMAVIAHAIRPAGVLESAVSNGTIGVNGTAIVDPPVFPTGFVVLAAAVLFLLIAFVVYAASRTIRFHRRHAPMKHLWSAAKAPASVSAVKDPFLRTLNRLVRRTPLAQRPFDRTFGAFAAPEVPKEPERTLRLRARPLAVSRGEPADDLDGMLVLLSDARGDGADRVCLPAVRLSHQAIVAAILAATPPRAIGAIQLVALTVLQLCMGVWVLVRRPSTDLLASWKEGIGLVCESASSVVLLVAMAAQPAGTPALNTVSAILLAIGTVGIPLMLSMYDDVNNYMSFVRMACRRSVPGLCVETAAPAADEPAAAIAPAATVAPAAAAPEVAAPAPADGDLMRQHV